METLPRSKRLRRSSPTSFKQQFARLVLSDKVAFDMIAIMLG
jgi:hypothetical protein